MNEEEEGRALVGFIYMVMLLAACAVVYFLGR
jgi:hypothetical protein